MISLLYIQQWSKNSFEYNYLNNIKKVINHQNMKMYLGFDYGYFSGINVYYGSSNDPSLALKLKDCLIKNKLNVRLCVNIPYDFDIILLLGYTNLKKERHYLIKKKKNLMKALSFFN